MKFEYAIGRQLLYVACRHHNIVLRVLENVLQQYALTSSRSDEKILPPIIYNLIIYTVFNF